MLYSSANLTKDIRGSIYCIHTCIRLARLTVKCGVPFFHHNTKYIHVHIQLVTAVKTCDNTLSIERKKLYNK